MKVSLLLLLSSISSIGAFCPSPSFLKAVPTGTSTTSVFISSWGTKGSPSRRAEDMENKNPEENIQAYLKSPEPVEARSNIDGTVLVSGLVNSKERTDQFVFDLLNHEDSAFEFTKIVAFVDNVAFAKKRLLSRSARYTGLLDKLEFSEASAEGALPSSEQLDGVKSWVAYVDNLDAVQQVANVAGAADAVENVAILLVGAVGLDAAACEASVQSLKDSGKQYTLVAVGQLEEHAEGKIPYKFEDFASPDTALEEGAIFSRHEAMRMITECLQLETGVNKALSVSEVYDANATEAKLIKGLREAGYARPQEIDHLLNDGPKKYQQAIDEFATKNPDYKKGYYTTEAWWEDEKFQASVKKSSLRKEEAIQKVKDERTQEIENIAKEWTKREYFRQSMAGEIKDTTEEEFKESVWERAMFEADLKYRQLKGEVTDSEGELASFKAQHERKKQAMLQRAKDEMKELLDAENLGGDDLEAKLESLDAADDNTED